jgi:hypothetical protein
MAEPVKKAELQQMANTARDALMRMRPDEARDPLQQLATLLPRDGAVRRLLQWAAVLGFDWAAARQSIPLDQRPRPAAADVDLVLFHVDLPRTPSGVHRPIDYMAVATMSFEAAMRRTPQTRRILLTDETTTVPDQLGASEVIRSPINRDRLMYERMRVQERYLAARAPGRATVFMDVDVVPNRDPADIFAEDFHVGLTWRENFPDAPINGGLIFVASGDEGRRFFQETLRCYERLASDGRVKALFDQDLRAWWGDQYALAAMLDYREIASRSHDAIAVDGIRVRLFPCADYNFTPEAGNYSAEFLTSRYFLHFKGNRKAMQAQYLNHIRAAMPA